MPRARSTELPVAWTIAWKCCRSTSSGTPPSPTWMPPRNSIWAGSKGLCNTRMTLFIFTWSGATP
jgi:hypothetical protein